jgi:hypothetical protein
MTTTTCTARYFLAANQVTYWVDIPEADRAISEAGHVLGLSTMIDKMLSNWTFGGALVPYRYELFFELFRLKTEAQRLYDSETSECLGLASHSQIDASATADDDYGRILIDSGGNVVEPGGFGSQGARKVFVRWPPLILMKPAKGLTVATDDDQ